MPAYRGPFLIFSVLVLAATSVQVRGDTLEFQDGRRVHGRLVSISHGWVEFQPFEGEDTVDQMRVALAEVRAIRGRFSNAVRVPGILLEGGRRANVASVSGWLEPGRDRRARSGGGAGSSPSPRRSAGPTPASTSPPGRSSRSRPRAR